MDRLMEILHKLLRPLPKLGGGVQWVWFGKTVKLWPFVALLIFVLSILLLTGCGSTPYAELGIGYQVDGMTDQLVRTTHKDQCSKQPQAHIELGLEFDHNWKLGYHHQSWLMCGKPFGNNRPEIYMEDIRLTKKFGGK